MLASTGERTRKELRFVEAEVDIVLIACRLEFDVACVRGGKYENSAVMMYKRCDCFGGLVDDDFDLMSLDQFFYVFVYLEARSRN